MSQHCEDNLYHIFPSEENKDCPKDFFRVINTLLNNKPALPLPPHDDASVLADQFAEFFMNKIDKIREDISSMEPSRIYPERKLYKTPLTNLRDADQEEVRKILVSCPAKSCELDPVPTWLLKLCCDEILPLITRIVNLIMTNSDVPKVLKVAAIKPLLKKIILELILRNYRPVSNLPFLSKVVEKVVLVRIREHITENVMHETFQSAYCKGHSTEAVLLPAKSDIQDAMDSQRVTLLMMLDTINYNVLLGILSACFGAALAWIQSYLTDREQ